MIELKRQRPVSQSTGTPAASALDVWAQLLLDRTQREADQRRDRLHSVPPPAEDRLPA